MGIEYTLVSLAIDNTDHYYLWSRVARLSTPFC